MLKKDSLKWVAIAGLIGVGAASAPAVVVFQFDDLVSGSTPGGSPPWATLTIADVGADTVNLTLTHNASSASGQFISALLLNMSPYPGNPTLLENSPKITGWSFDQDGIIDAGLIWDVRVEFETSNAGGGANRLKPGESVTWQISGTGLTESAFNTLSGAQGSNQPRLAMIHLQGIQGGLSGKISPVPEPGALAALTVGLTALLARRRTQRRSR